MRNLNHASWMLDALPEEVQTYRKTLTEGIGPELAEFEKLFGLPQQGSFSFRKSIADALLFATLFEAITSEVRAVGALQAAATQAASAAAKARALRSAIRDLPPILRAGEAQSEAAAREFKTLAAHYEEELGRLRRWIGNDERARSGRPSYEGFAALARMMVEAIEAAGGEKQAPSRVKAFLRWASSRAPSITSPASDAALREYVGRLAKPKPPFVFAGGVDLKEPMSEDDSAAIRELFGPYQFGPHKIGESS
jgi:hypothetical protein